MKVKSRIAPMECPKKYWLKTTEVEKTLEIPKELIKEAVALWPDLQKGRAKDQAAKSKMIELYNTIYGANYSTGTNCGSCISACFDGIKKIYNEYINEYSKGKY